MTVFQVLPEMICTVEFFGLIALPELVDLAQMLGPGVPVCGVGEFFTAVAADVRRGAMGGRRVESGLNASQGGARPRVSAKVQRVLVSLGLVLVLEAVRAVLALVLLFHRVESMRAISTIIDDSGPKLGPLLL